jgi:SAM-dependent methyltransferase
VIERALAGRAPFQRALDIGCGAGVSTKALEGFAKSIAGLEPAIGMLRWARSAAHFVAGCAEAIPFLDRSFDLITAAGSLNYTNLDLFFPEAARVLSPGGVLLVYDFSPGRTFRDADGLDEWFAEFHRRYPPPAGEGRELSPEILGGMGRGFRPGRQEWFEIGITLTPEFYLDYVLTETNVASAVRRGAPEAEIRRWCAETLAPLWKNVAREVLFRGYFACLSPD